MWTNLQFPGSLFTFMEEILNGKLSFYSVYSYLASVFLGRTIFETIYGQAVGLFQFREIIDWSFNLFCFLWI